MTLICHPKCKHLLVKRPLLASDNFVLVGFKEAEWAEQLKPQ